MLYEHDITVTAGTAETAKIKTSKKLCNGVIHRLGVYMPPGCSNMVKCSIHAGLHQIFPTNPDGCIKADGYEVTGTVFEYLNTEPYTVDIYTWSPDTAHNHTITVRLWILRLWQLLPYSDKMYQLMVAEGGIEI